MLAFLPNKRIVRTAMIQVLPLFLVDMNDRFLPVACVVRLPRGV